MPKVYSDPLHEELEDLVSEILENVKGTAAESKLKTMLEKMKAAPTWRPGQAYANPSKIVEVKVKSKS